MNEVYGITNKAKIVILSANAYDMITEEKERMKGCSVRYMFFGEEGERLQPQVEWDTDQPVGAQPAKCSIDFELRRKIVVAPAVYEGDFEMKIGSDGKPVLKLVDVAYISNLKFEQVFDPDMIVPGMIRYVDELPADKTAKDTKPAK